MFLPALSSKVKTEASRYWMFRNSQDEWHTSAPRAARRNGMASSGQAFYSVTTMVPVKFGYADGGWFWQ